MNGYSTQPSETLRRFERKPLTKAIEYVMEVPGTGEQRRASFRGKTVDISETGLGIETDYPLAPGHTLWVNGGIDKAGKVLWAVRTDVAYRAGIQFDLDGVLGKGHAVLKTKDPSVSEDREVYLRRLDNATESFMNQLEVIEKRCADPAERPEDLRSAVAQTVDEMMSECKAFERGMGHDKKILKDAQIRFREKTHPIISKSYTMNRTRVWPQGSQGDYKTLELAYKNTPLSEGIGYYLDLSFLNTTLARAVRSRIKRLEHILGDDIEKRDNPTVMNIGCGSCRELMGIAPEIIKSEARITCMDLDNDALAFAQDRLAYAGILTQVELRRYNVLRMFDDEMNMAEFGKQDIIYSVGLFDYLPTDFLIKLLGALYRLLNPGGKLIASFKDAEKYRSQDYHWLVDWDGFRQRREEDFTEILSSAGIPYEDVAESREDSGVIIFYEITKQPQP